MSAPATKAPVVKAAEEEAPARGKAKPAAPKKKR